MRQNGFSLVELLVVIAIMVTLSSIATLSWNSMQKKSAIEKEIRMLYTDLSATRLDALYTKRSRKVVLSGTQFSTYSSNIISVDPVSRKTLRYPLKWNTADASLTLTFDASGLSAAAEIPVCVDPDNSFASTNDGAVDSIVISATRIKLGKRTEGSCATGNITQK